MRAEVVGVGTELLLGQIANTNARWISERLAEIGVDVFHHSVVGDNAERIESVLRAAIARSDLVLVTGGLGPTGDDITRDAIAAVLGVPLVRHAELEDMLRDRFAGFGTTMPESNLRQADVPEGARYVRPQRGTAPALVAETGQGVRIYAMAGPPEEMREVMEGIVLPELGVMAGPAVVHSRVLRCTGMGESAVAERLEDLFLSSGNPSVAYLASPGEVRVRLTAKATTDGEAEALLEPLRAEVVRRLGDIVFSTEGEDLEVVVQRLLRDRGLTVACAESLTGGRLAAAFTEVPGSSATFVGSVVAYTADTKRDLVGVRQETLDGPGVVSEACARELAAGARRLFGSDVGLGVTGAAGPDAHAGQDPGTVWIALEDAAGVVTRELRLPVDRERVMRWTVLAALDLVRRRITGLPMRPRDTG